MAISSRTLAELILLGPLDDRRQLQDSPILGDVWIAFANKPTALIDILITPYKTQSSGRAASAIARRLDELGIKRDPKGEDDAHVAYLQGIVAARLYFRDVLRVIVPMTDWWRRQKVLEKLKNYDPAKLGANLSTIIKLAKTLDVDSETLDADSESPETSRDLTIKLAELSALERYVALAALILWAAKEGSQSVGHLIDQVKDPKGGASEALELFETITKDEPVAQSQIWQLALNRTVTPAVARSVPAIKADAARTLFSVKCDEINWAVIDSGIDGTHHAFKDASGGSRIIQAFDFSNIRQIISLDNRDDKRRKARIAKLFLDRKLSKREMGEADEVLQQLAEDADNDRAINWELVETFVKIDRRTPPSSNHGTHVAGIIGARIDEAKSAVAQPSETSDRSETEASEDGEPHELEGANGVCPDIKLYDFRVLSKTLEDTEFAIIAVLQFIRHLNERHSYISIHGVNLSLSIPHDVRNYACGRTPVCDECERLVESGIVVVAAAGNHGYQSFETKGGSYQGYTAFSITDPGNADDVITVGATHRYWPHTYGVSFFSSRGPTGDGRMKPDIVAPGERIEAPVPEGWGQLDGTSMAAPHVSGAAAMLMARYSELIGQPRRIKQILCETATDLGRERSFQGHGMLDVLRAFQSI